MGGAMAQGLAPSRTVMLFPWGNEIEDYLGPIKLDLDVFCRDMTGGWLFGYAEALRRQGWRVVILVLSRSIDARQEMVHAETGATIVGLPSPAAYRGARGSLGDPYRFDAPPGQGRLRRTLWRTLRAVAPFLAIASPALLREIRRTRPDVLLCQEYEYARFDVLVRLARRMGIRCVATFQGGQVLFSRLEGRWRAASLAMAHALVVPSASEARRLTETYPDGTAPVSRVPNPFDCEGWPAFDRAEARRELGWDGDDRIAIWHGRIDIRTKGLDILLQAWRELVADAGSERFRLVLIGDGVDADAFATLLARSRLPGVDWQRGFLLDRRELARRLHAADAYVMTSRQEGFPVAPLEAMASALPVVLSDAPGCLDILAGAAATAGTLVSREDPAATAAALGALLRHPDRAREQGLAARRHVAATFSLDAVGAALSAALDGPA